MNRIFITMLVATSIFVGTIAMASQPQVKKNAGYIKKVLEKIRSTPNLSSKQYFKDLAVVVKNPKKAPSTINDLALKLFCIQNLCCAWRMSLPRTNNDTPLNPAPLAQLLRNGDNIEKGIKKSCKKNSALYKRLLDLDDTLEAIADDSHHFVTTLNDVLQDPCQTEKICFLQLLYYHHHQKVHILTGIQPEELSRVSTDYLKTVEHAMKLAEA